MEKLRNVGTALRDVAERIFQGIIPGADAVYAVYFLEEQRGVSKCFSKALNRKIEIESALLRKIVSGVNVSRYLFTEDATRVIYPYESRNEDYRLINPGIMADCFPNALAYFRDARTILDKRDHGSAKGHEWYRYVRTQNIGLQSLPKIAVPRLVQRLCAAYDSTGEFCLDNVDVGGILLPTKGSIDPLYLLGILNSNLLNYFFLHQTVPFRGGFFSANRQYIENLPIYTVDSNNTREKKLHDELVKLVDVMLNLRKQEQKVEGHELGQLKRQIEKTDHEIDERVYELYGITEKERKLIEGV